MDYKNYNDYELLYMVKENNDFMCDIIFNKYKNIIKRIAYNYFNSYRSNGIEYDDLIQEGYLGLNSAIYSFKEKENCSFYTFAIICIERQIKTYCKKISASKHEVLNNALSLDDDNNYFVPYTFDNVFNNILSKDDFIHYKNILSFKNSVVFELRYNGFSYKEISLLLDIPINTVDSRLCKVRNIIKTFN